MVANIPKQGAACPKGVCENMALSAENSQIETAYSYLRVQRGYMRILVNGCCQRLTSTREVRIVFAESLTPKAPVVIPIQ